MTGQPTAVSPARVLRRLLAAVVTGAVVATASALAEPAATFAAPAPVGAGTYENSSSAVTLSGAWTTTASSQDSGGSFATLGASGYAQISFKTSGARYITRTNPYGGIADVYVDGVKKASVDLYSATTQYKRVMYEVTGLPETTHTLRVVRTGNKNRASGGANVLLDAFLLPDIYPPAPPTSPSAAPEGTGARIRWTASPDSDVIGYRIYRREDGTSTRTSVSDAPITSASYLDQGLRPGTTYLYQVAALDSGGNMSSMSVTASVTTPINAVTAGTYENGSSSLTLSGAWTTTAGATTDSGGSFASLGSSGYAEISFRTSGVQWISRTNSYAGIADVYLDGVKKASVDLYSASTQYKRVVWSVAGLPETNHTLRVVYTGTKNSASTGRNIFVDAFVAPDIHPPAAPSDVSATLEKTGARISWTATASNDVAGYRVSRRLGTSGSFTSIASTGADETTLLDPGLEPGTTYQYQVSAVDSSGNVSDPSSVANVTTVINPQGAGTFENDSPEVTLNGAWTKADTTTDSGGSSATLSGAGYAELSFHTSGVRWISRTNAYGGIADVYLDGTKRASIDLYSASTKYQQVVYEVKDLPETVHTIRIVRTGRKNAAASGANLLLDAFNLPDIYPPAAPTGVAAAPERNGARVSWTASPQSDVIGYRIYRREDGSATGTNVTSAWVSDLSYFDDGLRPGVTYLYQVAALDSGGNESALSDTATTTTPITAMGAGVYENGTGSVTQSGPWTSADGPTTDSGGSFASLGAAGYAEFSFRTSGVRWISRTNSVGGIADVYLDGVKRTSVDLYSPSTRFRQTAYQISGLPETNHTIRIVYTGSKNPASSGRNVFLDAFVAPDIYPPSVPTGLTATPERTGARVSWSPSPEDDVTGYRVYRIDPASGTATAVGTTKAGTTTFLDVGLAAEQTYRFRVLAVDSWGNETDLSAPVELTVPAAAPDTSLRYATCPQATATVSNRSELVGALSKAAPGSVIWMNPGRYTGYFDVNVKGTASAPVWLCGPRSAVIDGGAQDKNYGLKVWSSANVIVAGMTVRNAQKGITVINSSAVTVADTRVEDIGEEAIHLRSNTTDSTVIGNSITRTGLYTPAYGEGVYVGSAEPNWCRFSNCLPDRSDRNTIVLNDISATGAEQLEAKEGAVDGIFARNTLNGAGMSNEADSLIAIQTNGWTVADNVGVDSPLDGIQIWEPSTGWGMNNVVVGNQFSGSMPGYAVHQAANELGNLVGCDNVAAPNSISMTHKPCQK